MRDTARRLSILAFVALVLLGLAWELWLAPLRQGGSMLALKVVPLALAIPGVARGRVRTYQWWSMGILAYVCEGVVRATSDQGVSAVLAAGQTALALVGFTAILLFVKATRRVGAAPAARIDL